MHLIFASIIVLAVGHASALPLRESLAMFESGARPTTKACQADRMRGHSGEVSRFQIMPDVWREYSRSTDYENPTVAWSVAEHILADRKKWFTEKTGREASPVELYLLWNKPAHFRAVGFDLARVRPFYRIRAQRFANLCMAS